MARLTPVQRAQRGAAFLDEHRPSWWRKVRITRLNIEDANACVLGQLFTRPGWDSGFYLGCEHFGISTRQQAILGFDLPSYDDSEWDSLTEAWRDEIRSRRKAAGR